MNHLCITIIIVCWTTIKIKTEDCKKQTVLLNGAGSSLAATLYTELGMTYSAQRSQQGQQVVFDYKSRNSGYGLDRITMALAGHPPIVFGASDKSMSNEQHNRHNQLKMFPTFAGALLTIYNVPEAKNITLVLSEKVLAEIYEGKIKYWDDPKIMRLNQAINFTHNKILLVARSDNSGETFILTGALSQFDNSWGIYGTFSDPEFVGGICCNSSRWPIDVVEFFAKGVNGMIGIVASIPYTLGYASQTNVLDNDDVKFAHLINAASLVTTANTTSVQAAMNYHLSRSRGSMVFDLNNAFTKQAYPMASFSYMVVNSSTHPQISCCQMQELTGFIEFILKADLSYFAKHQLVPLSQRMISSMMLNAVRVMHCRGKLVYTEYLASSEQQFHLELWHGITIALAIMLFILLVVIIIWSIHIHKRNQLSMKKWLLTGRVVIQTDISEEPNDIEEADENKIEKFQCMLGEYEGSNVLLDMLNIRNSPGTWSHKTQLVITNLRVNIIHPNITNFLGINEMNAFSFVVHDYASKGNLHYVLQTCRYALSESIKYNLALNAAEGLAFLHQKQIVHGQLSSINCYVDGSWSIKIGGWYRFSIMSSEANPSDVETEFSINQINSRLDLIKGIYMDANFMKMKNSNCDVYSFGLLLVEIFSRKLPFKEPTADFIKDKANKPFEEIESKLNFSLMSPNLLAIVTLCIGETSSRPCSQDLVSMINQLKPANGLVDGMMKTMEDYAHDLEQRSADLTAITEHMRDLLNDVLPPEVAMKLLKGENVAPDFFECITIYFSEIIGFIDISRRSMPLEVMTLLNNLWILFDDIIQKFDVYKVDTIGDAYMVCSGLPKRNNNEHSKNISDLALALLEAVSTFEIPHFPEERLQIRIGINSGPVTTGVVGSKMPQYCIFGDAVNTASRMQSTCEPMKIQASDNTVQLLKSHFPERYELEPRGDVEVKGKGMMKTYWLSRTSRRHRHVKSAKNKFLKKVTHF